MSGNGIRIFRERAGMSKAELARRVGTTRQQLGRLEESQRKLTTEWAERIASVLGCTAPELIFPEMARIDTSKTVNVFAIGLGEELLEPDITLDAALLEKMGLRLKGRSIRMMIVPDDDMREHARRGDTAIIDINDRNPGRPGIFALSLNDEIRLRRLTPLTADKMIDVRADDPNVPQERIDPSRLEIVGRVILRLSTV